MSDRYVDPVLTMIRCDVKPQLFIVDRSNISQYPRLNCKKKWNSVFSFDEYKLPVTLQ